MTKNQNLIKRMVMISILSALSVVLYNIGPKFELPIFPSFLTINFSMIPIFIGLFMLGTRDALIIVLIRFIIKLPFTSTSCVGELADLILGVITISITGLLNYFVKCKGKEAIVFVGAIVSWIIAGLISNCFSLPLYMAMFGGKNMIIGSMNMISNVNESNYIWKYMLICVIPFNLILSSMVVLVTYPIHFRLKSLYDNFNQKEKKKIK